MRDDLGYGDVVLNGNSILETPFLDATRSEGASFTRFFTEGPICSPTHRDPPAKK